MLKNVKSRSAKNNLKYGITVPRTVADAMELDRINGNDLWDKAFKKEILNVKIEFKLLEDN
jgi:formiminotetrahydrofolate cyclodeaminase